MIKIIKFIALSGLFIGPIMAEQAPSNFAVTGDMVDAINLTDSAFSKMEQNGLLVGVDQETIQIAKKMVERIISDKELYQTYVNGDLRFDDASIAQYISIGGIFETIGGGIKTGAEAVGGGIKTGAEVIISGIKIALPVVQAGIVTIGKTAGGVLTGISQNPELLAKISNTLGDILAKPLATLATSFGIPLDEETISARIKRTISPTMLARVTGFAGAGASLAGKLAAGEDPSVELNTLKNIAIQAAIQGVIGGISSGGINPLAYIGGALGADVSPIPAVGDVATQLSGAAIQAAGAGGNSLEGDAFALSVEQAPSYAVVAKFKELTANIRLRTELLKMVMENRQIRDALQIDDTRLAKAKALLAEDVAYINSTFIVTDALVNEAGAKKCLDADAASAGKDGGKVQAWGCWYGNNQRWTFTEQGYLVNNSGLCLDVNLNDYGKNNGWVSVWTCNGGKNQKWEKVNGNAFRMIGTNQCLDLDAAQVNKDGGLVHTWQCGNGTNQQWKVAR